MANPWEKYAQNDQADMRAPWGKYSAQQDMPSGEDEAPEPGLIRQKMNEFFESHPNVARGVQTAGRVLDYPGGLIRTTAAGTAGLLEGKPVGTSEDFANAWKGQAPTSAEYLKRLGLDSGGNVLDNSITGKVTLRDLEGFGLDVVTDPFAWASRMLKGAGTAVDKTLNPASRTAEAAGKGVYKSGMKDMDLAAARQGAKAPSDVLFENRVAGNSQAVFDQMNNLADQLLQKRNDILKQATRGGAETDMHAAVGPAQDFVNQMRKTANPELHKAADMLQGRINDYLSVAAKEPESRFVELPYSKEVQVFEKQPEVKGYVANTEKLSSEMGPKNMIGEMPGESFYSPARADDKAVSAVAGPNDQVVSLPQGGQMVTKRVPAIDVGLDQTERVSGPSPLQTSAWKTTAANKAGDAAYDQLARSSEGQGFNKALASGLRQSTAEAVGRTLGPEAQAKLQKFNSDLGAILASDDKARIALEKEARKNGFTSVDGMLVTHPEILATKKIADVMKGSAARTKIGLALSDLGKEGLLDPMIRQSLAGTNPPPKDRGPGLLRHFDLMQAGK